MRTTRINIIDRIEQGLQDNKLPRDRSREANLFSIIEYGNSYETRGTRLIRWLCDPQAEHGFAAFFVDRLFAFAKAERRDVPVPKPVNAEKVQAFAEESLVDLKRNDVMVVEEPSSEGRGKTLTIEHKTHSKEGRLSNGLLQRQGYFQITNEKFSPSLYDNYFIYLTPSGERPFTPSKLEDLNEFASWVYISYEQVWDILEEALSLLEEQDNQNSFEDSKFVIRQYIADLKFHVQNQSSDRKKYICENILLSEGDWSSVSEETVDVLVALCLGMLGSEIKLFPDLQRELLDIGMQFASVAEIAEELQAEAQDHWNAWKGEFSGSENHLRILVEHVWAMFLSMQKSTRVLNEGIDVFIWMLDKHVNAKGELNYSEEVQKLAEGMIREFRKQIESDQTLRVDTQTKQKDIIRKTYPELSISFSDINLSRPAVLSFNGSGRQPKFSFKLQCQESVARSQKMVSFLNSSSEFEVPGLTITLKDWEKSKEKRKAGSKHSRNHVLTLDVSLSAEPAAVKHACDLIKKYATVISHISAT